MRDALERKRLLAEKQRLEELTAHQNEELKMLNTSLEENVRERTEELHAALEHLKDDYLATLHVFSNLMELRKGTLAGHSRRIAQLCCSIAHKMHLPESDIQTIETAALLHNIGKITLPDHLLDKPYMELTHADRAEFDKHPLRAAAALMALDPLVEASELIRHHRESYNGTANPSGLRGEQLPLGSRILLVASDFENLQQGLVTDDKLSVEQAVKMIAVGSNSRYDPAVVNVFRDLVSHDSNSASIATEFQMNSDQLHEGMSLRQDVVTSSGMLLLLKNTVLNMEHLRQIREFERTTGERLVIYTNSI